MARWSHRPDHPLGLLDRVLATTFTAALAVTLTAPLAPAVASGDDRGTPRPEGVRYYAENGITYRETRRTLHERVPTSRVEERTKTVYEEKYSTEMTEATRVRWVPVTETRLEPVREGTWNPLARASVAYRSVPHTRWEPRTEVVKVPVTTRQLVPTTQTVRQPVVGWQNRQREVVHRTPVRGAGGRVVRSPSVEVMATTRDSVGGIFRLDRNPPRSGVSTASRSAVPTNHR